MTDVQITPALIHKLIFASLIFGLFPLMLSSIIHYLGNLGG